MTILQVITSEATQLLHENVRGFLEFHGLLHTLDVRHTFVATMLQISRRCIDDVWDRVICGSDMTVCLPRVCSFTGAMGAQLVLVQTPGKDIW
jgi:hypothetical protein